MQLNPRAMRCQVIRIIGILLLLVCLSRVSQAEPDSLLARLPRTQGTERVDALNTLSEAYASQTPATAYQYADQALQLACQLEYTAGQAAALNNLGEVHLNNGEYTRALTLFSQGLTIGEKTNNAAVRGRSLYNMGVVYYFRGDFSKSISYQSEAIRLFHTLNAKKETASALNILAYIYGKEGWYQKALAYHLNALKIRREVGDQNEIAKSLNSIGDYYLRQNDLLKAHENYSESYEISHQIDNKKGQAISLNKIGVIQEKQGKHQNALQSHARSLAIHRELGNKKEIATVLQSTAVAYQSLGEYATALQFLHDALAIYEVLRNDQDICAALNSIADVYRAQGNYSNALAAHRRAITLAVGSASKPLLKDTYQAISQTYLTMNQAEQFMKYHKLFAVLRDSLALEETNWRVAHMEKVYEEEKKQEEIDQIKREKESQEARLEMEATFRNFLITCIILVAILAVVLYYFYREKDRYTDLLSSRNAIITQKNEELRRINLVLNVVNGKLQESETELRKSNETKDRFFSIIAHDLRGPLATFTGFLSLLSRDAHAFTQQQFAEVTSRTEKSLRNLSFLLNNLLQWSQSQMGKIQCKPETLRLSESADQVIALLGNEARNKQITLSSTIDERLSVCADRNMLSFILRNLTSNAIKFTPRQGKIQISAAPHNDRLVEVAVSDTGVGISPEKLNQLFQLNTSFTTPGTANEKGTGLGLLLSKEFVEKNNGAITAESTPGKGTIFRFTLPLSVVALPVKTPVAR